MAVNEPAAATLNRFSDENYQRRNWNYLDATIRNTVNKLLPPELQTLNRIIPSSDNSTDFLTLISDRINRTSSYLLTLNQNLIRGRSFFCNACFDCLEHQRHDHAAYAALIAVINSKHPQIGHLFLRRLVSDIKEAHARHNYTSLSLLVKVLAHLINHRVSAESLGLELVNFFLYGGKSPSDAIVMIAAEFVQLCGAALRMADSDSFDGVLDRLRELLSARRNSRLYRDISDDDSHVKVIVQAMASLRSVEFRNAVRVVPELDVVSEKERVTHSDISLYDDKVIDTERELDEFSYDPFFFDAYVFDIRSEIEFHIMSSYRDGIVDAAAMGLKKTIEVYDVNSIDNVEGEICWMIVELCGYQDNYKAYFGELGRRMHKEFETGYEVWRDVFVEVYDKIERYDKKKAENIAKLFGDMMGKVKEMPMTNNGKGLRVCYGLPWKYVLDNIIRSGDMNQWKPNELTPFQVFIKALFDQVDVKIGSSTRIAVLRDMELDESAILAKGDKYAWNIRNCLRFLESVGRESVANTHRRQELFDRHDQALFGPQMLATCAEIASNSSIDDDTTSRGW